MRKKFVIVYYHKKDDGGENPVTFVRDSLPPSENTYSEIKLSPKD